MKWRRTVSTLFSILAASGALALVVANLPARKARSSPYSGGFRALSDGGEEGLPPGFFIDPDSDGADEADASTRREIAEEDEESGRLDREYEEEESTKRELVKHERERAEAEAEDESATEDAESARRTIARREREVADEEEDGVARKRKYLGNLNRNSYDPNSVSNPYGTHGSQYSPDSINNPYGQYGSRYSPNGANNPYTTGGPEVVDPGTGKSLGTMNANPYDPNSISNPYGVHGSRYAPDSVNNPYGQYGRPYGATRAIIIAPDLDSDE